MKMTSRRGYTMIEVLLVIAVIGILVTILVASVGNITRNARIARVETEVMALEQAFRAYNQLYGRWPRHPDLIGDGNVSAPERSTGGLKVNSHMVRLLRGENHPTGMNPRRVAFMEISDASIGTSEDNDPGHFVDAWGNAYRYMFDFTLDNSISIPPTPAGILQYYSDGGAHSKIEGRTVIVWSLGPSGSRSPSPPSIDDNIRSWD